jgi:hypothetical protein
VCPISGCNIDVNKDLPEPQPLLLKPKGSKDGRGFYLPKDDTDNVTITGGDAVLFACPGNNNGFKTPTFGIQTASANCDSGTVFNVNSYCDNFSKFACKRYPSPTTITVHSSICCNGKKNIVTGFQVDTDFYKLMNIGFDDVLYTTLYVKSTIISGIAGYQKGKEIKDFTAKVSFLGSQ